MSLYFRVQGLQSSKVLSVARSNMMWMSAKSLLRFCFTRKGFSKQLCTILVRRRFWQDDRARIARSTWNTMLLTPSLSYMILMNIGMQYQSAGMQSVKAQAFDWLDCCYYPFLAGIRSRTHQLNQTYRPLRRNCLRKPPHQWLLWMKLFLCSFPMCFKRAGK